MVYDTSDINTTHVMANSLRKHFIAQHQHKLGPLLQATTHRC